MRFIPEQHTDFIFSALGEETGFIGCPLVVMGFTLLMARLLQVARNARTDFESLVVVGIGTMLMFQVVVNIFMTIGLGPITGIPLPFLSYGRSAMIVNFSVLASASRWCDAVVGGFPIDGERHQPAWPAPSPGPWCQAGRCDEAGVRRLWWGALEVIQQALLERQVHNGLWMAALAGAV